MLNNKRKCVIHEIILIKTPPKNPFFTRAQNKSLSPRACEPARAQTPLNSVPGVWGFSWCHQNGMRQYAFLIGPFVSHDINTRFWLVTLYTGAILLLLYGQVRCSIFLQRKSCFELITQYKPKVFVSQTTRPEEKHIEDQRNIKRRLKKKMRTQKQQAEAAISTVRERSTAD